MTETEWQKSPNARAMLAVVRDKGSDRLWRLFAVACVRTVEDRLIEKDSRAALDVAERVADGLATEAEWLAARELAAAAAARARRAAWQTEASEDFFWTKTYEASLRVSSFAEAAMACVAADFNLARFPEGFQLPDQLREIFGNPFQWHVVEPAWQSWNGGIIPSLATKIYADRAFDRLPLLADALEDAGCTDGELLGHLRGPGPHCRGCWALDILLGKS
jgi:hypothetical protein